MPEQRVNILIYRPDGTLIAQYLLGDGEHLIGRDINCPVYLDSEYISNNHAKLYLSHDGIQIEDLNSTSGTFLDSVTVRGKLRIKPGQTLQVGDLTVQLQPESEGQIGPGSRLGDGRYTLIRMLGRGGMGEVWLAKDEQLEEEVALKKLPPEVGADAMALADMRREVQKSRALSHPNIIRIHDLIQQAGEDPLISLEYVDGTDLTAIAATKTNGVFDWVAIKDWMLQLANALEYAHEEKIVHRDLKPGNIMISRTGRLKLADFGIAATVADSLSRSSMQGFVSGTTLYMSPQQMEGAAPKETDDVYAFGATIYELLTSRPPFYTGNVEHQVLQVTPTPPSQRLGEFGFVGQIPPHVQELVMACLAKVPEGRPQSMGAIRDWIQSDGKAEGAIPKPSTKTIKHAAPVAAGGEPAGVAQESGSSGWSTYVVALVLLIICFTVGKMAGGDKKEKQPPGNDDNGSAATFPGSKRMVTILGKDIQGEEFGSSGENAYRIGDDGRISVSSNSWGFPQILIFGPEVSEGEISAEIQYGSHFPSCHAGLVMCAARSNTWQGQKMYHGSPALSFICLPDSVLLTAQLPLLAQNSNALGSPEFRKPIPNVNQGDTVQLKMVVTRENSGRMVACYVNGDLIKEQKVEAELNGRFALYAANSGFTFSNVTARYPKLQ